MNHTIRPCIVRMTLTFVGLFLPLQLWAFGAFASTPGEPSPSEIFVTWSYVAGSLTAIVYKMSVGSAKHIMGKSFRLRALFLPILWSAIISFPLVFMIMPKFGRPTGVFTTDMIYSYLTTYALIDMAADFFIISDIIRAKFQEAVDKDNRASHPDAKPPGSPGSSR